MSDCAPTQVGPYEITCEIGRGGMGVVYLARDTTLDRDVAIKALPPEFAEDEERLSRFEREAKTLAQLNHPNIAGIYGIEEHNDQKYLVLEYVEGETLGNRLDRGALPFDDAIEIAIEIAAGVEAAHDSGVIHRDLKPDNIKITADGKVKVLDFGLARVEESSSTTGAGGATADSPTLTSPARHSPTMPGVILGTAAYMSPEQARGRRVDKRTDIWSFGVILYEMLAGIGPFVGETVTDSIGAILHKQINFDQLPSDAPRSLHRVLQRCLVRDRNLRLRDIGDARLELQTAPFEDEAVPTARASRRPLIVATIVTTALLALAIGYATGQRSGAGTASKDAAQPPRPEPIQFEFPIGALQEDDAPSQMAISPTDRMIVAWAGRAKGDPADALPAVCVHDLRTGVTTRLAGTEGARCVAFSSDGRQIAFSWSDRNARRVEFRRVGTNGGPVVRIVSNTRDFKFRAECFAWTPADELLLVTTGPFTLHAVSVNSGNIRKLGSVSGMDDVFVAGTPILAHEDTVFIVGVEPRGPSTFAIDLPSMTATRVVRGGGAAYPIGPDRLVYAQDETLFVAPYDDETKAISGSVQPILSDLVSVVGFTVSAAGDLLAVRGEMSLEDDRQIFAMNREGVGEPLIARKDTYSDNIVVSPDGVTIAANINDRTSESIPRGHLIDRATGAIRPIEIGDDRIAIVEHFTHDGRLAVVSAANINHHELVLLDPEDDAEPMYVLPETDSEGGQHGFALTRDGRYALFAYRPNEADREDGIYMVDLSLPVSERQAIPIVATTANESVASIHPDGEWIAYTTDASGREQVVVQAFDPERPDARARPIPVSIDGGNRQNWSLDGTELFFISPDGNLMSAAVTIDAGRIEFSAPEVVLTHEQTRMHQNFGFHVFSELPGEDRFLFIREPDLGEMSTRYDYIMNWTSALESVSSLSRTQANR